MSLSDCSKCWDTPCTCGWDLRRKNIKYLESQQKLLTEIIKFKKENPNAKYSEFGKPETNDDKRFMEHLAKNR